MSYLTTIDLYRYIYSDIRQYEKKEKILYIVNLGDLKLQCNLKYLVLWSYAIMNIFFAGIFFQLRIRKRKSKSFSVTQIDGNT